MNRLSGEDFKKSRIYLILKFKELVYKLHLNQLISHKEVEIFKSISSTNFLHNHSDFLEQEIHELSSIDKIESLSKLKIHFFDSFFNLLPINTSFLINDFDIIILPKLGIRITQIKELKKTEISKLMLTDNLANEIVINLNNCESEFKWKKIKILDSLFFISDNSNFLFNKEGFSEISNIESINNNLSKKIVNSLEIIRNTSQDFYFDLKKRLHYIFPFGNDENFTFPNFTIPTLKKSIFLSVRLLEETDLHVAECIIHESSHCKLNIIQDTVLLFTSPHNKLEYYSPWRKDLRPLIGLIHGIYISNDLIDFYFDLIQKKNHYEDESREKIEIIIHQILIAFDEINKEYLTSYANNLLSSIVENVKQKASKIEIDIYSIPQSVKIHKKQWKETPLKL